MGDVGSYTGASFADKDDWPDGSSRVAGTAFGQPQIMQLGSWRFSDHNRQELQVSTEHIENASRMVNGTMRKQFIAAKRTFTTSWENLPGPQWATVDGYFGADDIIDFYKNNRDVAINLIVQYGRQLHGDDDTTDVYSETIPVFMSDCSWSITKRGFATRKATGATIPMALYSLNITLVEV